MTSMQPVTCGECGAQVGVHKRNSQHTAVQWHGDAVERCKWFQVARAAGERSAAGTLSCYALCAGIEKAVRDGSIHVHHDDAHGFSGIGSLEEAVGADAPP
ncbi:hypothetical protein [Tomitella cavernea]|uniref:C2H2-type domain-containing protein n=1 Tax=Tomitella cavernea TaxID=1387982 RepID=A0ABP9C2M1_9ACTN|nr:hypothetical protein [Tomitella cavernea]